MITSYHQYGALIGIDMSILPAISATRYGYLVDSTTVESTAISPSAMFQLGRYNLDAEVRRELLDRAIS